MAVEIRRADLQRLAFRRVAEARVLCRNGEWSGSYYLAGLAVEFALKARIARQFKRAVWPDQRFVRDIYTHELIKLVGSARLKIELDSEQGLSADFKRRWGVVKDWSVDARYREWQEPEAKDMLDAVAHRRHGVFRWIRARW